MFDPMLAQAFFQITLMMAWFWGWLRHPLLMFIGFMGYLALR